MSGDFEVAIMGTGVAPLVAANMLQAHGKNVLLLNPDWDFFRENSELPLDPLWPISADTLTPQHLKKNLSQQAVESLRPDFPGAVEYCPVSEPSKMNAGVYDSEAPCVRSRSRLWIRSDRGLSDMVYSRYWDLIEDMFVEASDAGLHPQELEGLPAARRFPGYSGKTPDMLRGILLPSLCDVDVVRYRNGLLEYLRERMGAEKVVCSAVQIELLPDGLKYYSEGSLRKIRLDQGMLIFWTPALTSWIIRQTNMRRALGPTSVQIWEEWTLTSKDPLDPGVVGVYEDMIVWAEVEGALIKDPSRLTFLKVLRAGPIVDAESMNMPVTGSSWASGDSFNALSRLCHDFLKWDKFSVRSMQPRAVFQLDGDVRGKKLKISHGKLETSLVLGSDGPIVDVVSIARQVAEGYL